MHLSILIRDIPLLVTKKPAIIKVQRIGDCRVHTDPFHAQGSLQREAERVEGLWAVGDYKEIASILDKI